MHREKLTFEEILKDIRGDLDKITKMAAIFLDKTMSRAMDEEARTFFYDIFIDKIYETNEKIRKFARDLGIGLGNPDFRVDDILSIGKTILLYGPNDTTIKKLVDSVNYHIMSIEVQFSGFRKLQHRTGWKTSNQFDVEVF